MECWYDKMETYTMKWTLKDENGLVWDEKHEEISFDDACELVGMNIHQILEMEMRLLHGKTDCNHKECKSKEFQNGS